MGKSLLQQWLQVRIEAYHDHGHLPEPVLVPVEAVSLLLGDKETVSTSRIGARQPCELGNPVIYQISTCMAVPCMGTGPEGENEALSSAFSQSLVLVAVRLCDLTVRISATQRLALRQLRKHLHLAQNKTWKLREKTRKVSPLFLCVFMGEDGLSRELTRMMRVIER